MKPSDEAQESARGTCTLHNGEAVARHAGAACLDPDCLFRRPIQRSSVTLGTAFADRLRAQAKIAATAMRLALGLGPGEQRSAPAAQKAPPPMPHLCHFPDCKEPIEPRFLMCAPHWRLTPKPLRDAVKAHYRPGQERDKRTSPEYRRAVREAIEGAMAAEKKLRAVLALPQLSLFGKEKP